MEKCKDAGCKSLQGDGKCKRFSHLEDLSVKWRLGRCPFAYREKKDETALEKKRSGGLTQRKQGEKADLISGGIGYRFDNGTHKNTKIKKRGGVAHGSENIKR